MDEQAIIWCGPDKPQGKLRKSVRVELNSVAPFDNVNLKINSIARKLARNLPSLLADLLEIAGYVYAGDQCVSRGGPALDREGARWRRELEYHIPVRNVSLWSNSAVQDALIDLLTFLSDDYYDFKFRLLTREVPMETYFEFDRGAPWFEADEVLLYSGGLDSLAGVCDAVLNRHKRAVLVSHRPAPQTFAVQQRLLKDFERETKVKNRLLFVPVIVNKAEKLTKDTHQRTRSFLYSALAASLAIMHGIDRIAFCENGITSSNLIASPSTKGARASRTTHPKSLNGMTAFLSTVFERVFKVENPLFWKTKADVIRMIVDSGQSGLIRHTTSCSHVRSGDPLNNHCGVCSQCVGRRLATVSNGLADHDPEEMYKVRIPMDSMPSDMDRSMVELLIKTARDFEQQDVFDFYRNYGGPATAIVTSLSGKADENASKLYDLHRRHGVQVCAVLERFIDSNKSLIARSGVPQDSLLGMILGMKGIDQDKKTPKRGWRLPPGISWEDITIEIVGVDAAKIIAGADTHAASAQEMGFIDKRKKAPNQLWDLLVDFAEAGGNLRWDSTARSRDWNSKDFQRLRSGLKEYFQLEEDPFEKYRKEDGYRCRFKILYDRSVKA